MKNQKILKIKKFFIKILRNHDNYLYIFLNYLFTFLILVSLTLFFPLEIKKQVKLNEILKRNIIAKNNVKYFDPEASRKKEEIIKSTTVPIFIYNKDYIKLQIEKMKKALLRIEKTQKYSEYLLITPDEEKINLTEEDYYILKECMKGDNNFKYKFLSLYENLSYHKIIENNPILNKYELNTLKIGEYEDNNFRYVIHLFEEIYTEKSIKNKIELIVEKFFNSNHYKNIIKKIIINNIVPNVIFDEENTKKEINKRIETEAKIYRLIPKGKIFEKGTIVTTENINEINAIIDAERNKYTPLNIISNLLFLFLISISLYFSIYHTLNSNSFNEIKNHYFFSLVIISATLYFLFISYIGNTEIENPYYGFYILISAISISLMILYSKLFSFMFTLYLNLLFFYLSNFSNIASFIFLLFSGSIIILLVSQLNKRMDLLLIGLINSIINIFTSLFIFLTFQNEFELIKIIFLSILNGMLSSLLAFLILLLAENFLNIATVFRLNELANFSSPLLKNLFNYAIGTYNHSIIVGNLAESAALEIGANAPLAKVGGYYHDIGKLENPEYFIENQHNTTNKHNKLKPSMSIAIIKSHVRIGIELAKKARLPKEVIDIIEQHHGNTLIRYFYEEALKNDPEVKNPVNKINFHYQYKNPETPEAAIVLLADQVEAATRSLKKYTITNIEKIINNIVDTNFQEGILNNSGLTLKDITKIKKTFIKIITGLYHPRIDYSSTTKRVENFGVEIK